MGSNNINIASRPSFDAGSSNAEGCEHFLSPSKIRKTCHSHSSSNDSKRGESLASVGTSRNSISRNKSRRLGEHCNLFTNVFGFAPNEFLPWQDEQKPPQIDWRGLTESLCDDALGHCLFSGYLDTFETIRLATTSKRFERLASKHVQQLDLSRCQKLLANDVEAIVRRFPNLKDLDFAYCTQFGACHLAALVPLSNSLERLSLKGCHVDDDDVCSLLQSLSQSSCMGGNTRLKCLDLSAIDEKGSQRVGDATLKAISTHCPTLKSLGLAWCKNVSDAGLQTLIRSFSSSCHSMQLQELDVSLTNLTDESVPHLLTLVSAGIVKLDLSATKISGNALFTALGGVPREPSRPTTVALPLQELIFQFMEDMTLTSLQTFVKCPSFSLLRRVDVNWYTASDKKRTTVEAVSAVLESTLARNKRAMAKRRRH